MAADISAPRSRRGLLAAAVGGGLAALSGLLGRPSLVRGADGETVKVGGEYTSATVTHIEGTSGGPGHGILDAGIWGESAWGYGVVGTSYHKHGVYATSIEQSGIYASSEGSSGVRGIGGASGVYGSGPIGVQGTSISTTKPAMLGQSSGNNTGVQGYSGTGTPPVSLNNVGVYGYAAQNTSSRGIEGKTIAGTGVRGLSESGTGMYGVSTSSRGVYGNSGSGIGVLASTFGGGTALKAEGRVLFSTSGLTAVSVGANNKAISAGSDLVASSKVLCTLESNQAGLAIQRITKDITANSFTVYLNGAVASGKTASIAWFVIG